MCNGSNIGPLVYWATGRARGVSSHEPRGGWQRVARGRLGPPRPSFLLHLALPEYVAVGALFRPRGAFAGIAMQGESRRPSMKAATVVIRASASASTFMSDSHCIHLGGGTCLCDFASPLCLFFFAEIFSWLLNSHRFRVKVFSCEAGSGAVYSSAGLSCWSRRCSTKVVLLLTEASGQLRVMLTLRMAAFTGRL
jgi:hypothetical protein